MNDKTLAIGGAIALIIGLFLPIVSLPMVGQVNLIGNFTNMSSLALLALGVLALFLAAKDRVAEAIWPGGAAAAMLAYWFVQLQWRIAETKAAMTDALRDNPFAGLAQTAADSIQLQWGWLVLIAGAGAIVYAALRARKADATSDEAAAGPDMRMIAAASLLLALVMPVSDAWSYFSARGEAELGDDEAITASAMDAVADAEAVLGDSPSGEERAYIRDHLTLYDLEGSYFDSILDGRVPGVDFKIRNDGNRTLNEVRVLIRFLDTQGNAIAEEEYFPVLVSEYNFGDDNSPLRPNYIWQQEQGQFYSAKSVPSEWQAGKVTGKIVDIEFAPPGDSQ